MSAVPVDKADRRTTGTTQRRSSAVDDNDTQEAALLFDKEIVTLRTIVDELLALDGETRIRVAGYIFDRFGGA